MEDFRTKNDTSDIDFAFLATRGGLVRFHDNGATGKSKSAKILGTWTDLDKNEINPESFSLFRFCLLS